MLMIEGFTKHVEVLMADRNYLIEIEDEPEPPGKGHWSGGQGRRSSASKKWRSRRGRSCSEGASPSSSIRRDAASPPSELVEVV